MRRTAFLVLVVLVAAGCGGGRPQLGAAAAAHVPARADVFVAVRTSDPHWRSFARAALGRPLPRLAGAAGEIDLAVVDGRVVVVGSATTAHPLADDVRYRRALAVVPHGAHGVAYLSGSETTRRLLAVPGQVETLPITPTTHYRYRRHVNGLTVAVAVYAWTAAWLTGDGIGAHAHSGGLPIAESNRVRDVQQLVPLYVPRLFDEIPADAVAVLDLPLPQGTFELMPAIPKPVAALFPGDAIELPTLLDELLQGETAIYVRPGKPLPEVTLVTSPPDTGAALDALTQLPAIRGIPLHHASIGGQLVLSTSVRGIARFRGDGPKLSADADFRHAGMPELVAGAVYVTERGPAALRALGVRGSRPLVGYLGRDGSDATLTVRYGGATR